MRDITRRGRSGKPGLSPRCGRSGVLQMGMFRPSPRRILAAVIAVLLLAGGFAAIERWRHGDLAEARNGGAAQQARVPVTLARATISDMPIYLGGLGTVQAYNTVAVRTRIDGQIESVNFREGQLVEKGHLLVKIDARPYQATLDQAKAKKAQDEALLRNTKADLERYKGIGTFASRQQVDTQTALVAQQTAQLAADQAAVENAETQLGYATVTAPITGVAGFRQVDIGNIVNAATQTGIVTITQIEPISVIYTAPEDQLPAIHDAMTKGDVPVDARSTDGSRSLATGRLEVINNQVDTATGTIRLKAIFENKDHALWPGLSVTVRTRIGIQQNALTVPDDAVQHGPRGLFVYIVDGIGRAHIRPVKVSRSESGRSILTNGLAAGDAVVAAGQYRVDEGTLVEDAAPKTTQDKPEAR